MENSFNATEPCVCGFGNEFFTLEDDQPVCTICGGLVIKDLAEFFTDAEEESHKLVLVVDDQPFFRERIKEVLTENKHSVEEASDGLSAIRVLAESLTGQGDLTSRIDHIVLDLVMPGELDGFKTLAVLKTIAPGVPVIILTSTPPTKDLLHKLAKLGARKYLNKSAENIDQLVLKNISES